jgi:hypothetical protein
LRKAITIFVIDLLVLPTKILRTISIDKFTISGATSPFLAVIIRDKTSAIQFAQTLPAPNAVTKSVFPTTFLNYRRG